MADYFTIQVKEQGPVIVANDNVTDSLLIFGPALDGPTNKPVRVSSQSNAETIFGPLTYKGNYVSPNTDTADGLYSFNELVRAYSEAVRAGAKNIYLVRVGGTRANAVGAAAIGGAAGIAVESVYGGYHYNGITASMTTTTLTINQGSNLGGTVTYTFDATTTIQQLINTVNAENKVNAVRLRASNSTNLAALASTITGSCTLTGGTYGTEAPGDDNASNKYTMYQKYITAETGAFDSLADFETDLVLLAGIYLDDQVVTGGAATTTSIAQKLAEFCGAQNRQHPTHGFIGLRPLGFDSFDLDRVTTHITDYWESTSAGYVDTNTKWLKAGYFRNTGFVSTDAISNETVDYGAFISVVAGPDIRMSTPGVGLYQTNPVNVYAGLISSLPSELAATKQRLSNTLGLNFTIREKQLRRLVNGIGWDETTKTLGKGSFVVLRNNELNQSPEVAYDVTFANDRKPAFADLQPQRITAEAIRLIKRALMPFLGQPFNASSQMAMEAKVRSVLDGMVAAGKLHEAGEGIGYQFSINQTNPLQIANNEVAVDLILWPALQIKKIRVNTTVRRGS